MPPSLSTQYFQSLYDEADDPWGIRVGWYEQRKRALLLAALPAPRFAVCYEPGCSNGELTVLLARRCDRVIAWDVVEAALARARDRTAGSAGVEIRRAALPGDWPDGPADLVVFSEVGYYFDEADLRAGVTDAVAHLVAGGVLVAAHWRHEAPDYPLTGDRVHEVIADNTELHRLARYQDEDVVLEVFVRGPAVSVARRQGVV